MKKTISQILLFSGIALVLASVVLHIMNLLGIFFPYTIAILVITLILFFLGFSLLIFDLFISQKRIRYASIVGLVVSGIALSAFSCDWSISLAKYAAINKKIQEEERQYAELYGTPELFLSHTSRWKMDAVQYYEKGMQSYEYIKAGDSNYEVKNYLLSYEYEQVNKSGFETFNRCIEYYINVEESSTLSIRDTGDVIISIYRDLNTSITYYFNIEEETAKEIIEYVKEYCINNRS